MDKNKKVKKVASIIIKIMIALIVIIILSSIYYFAIMDRWSKPVIEKGMNYEIKTEQFANRNVFVVSSKNSENYTKIILYLHGGGYVEEMSPEYWYFIEKLVNDTNSIVVIPDYPLAPKYNYIDVFDMLEPLYKEMIQKINVQNFVLMGDSAGGGMALALLEKLETEKINLPNQTILISPWLDITMENSQIDEVQKVDTVLNKDVLKIAGITYAENIENTKNYLVSPIYGDLSIIDNVTIFTGTYDILNPDVHVLMEMVELQGKTVNLKEYEKAKHIWLIKQNTDENITKQAYEDLIHQIKKTI